MGFYKQLDCFTKTQITKAVSQVEVHLNIKDEIQITAFTIKVESLVLRADVNFRYSFRG